MANPNIIYTKIDADLKETAETILSQLGISPTMAIQLFYNQIALHQGIPFDLKLPEKTVDAATIFAQEELTHRLSRTITLPQSEKLFSITKIAQYFAE